MPSRFPIRRRTFLKAVGLGTIARPSFAAIEELPFLRLVPTRRSGRIVRLDLEFRTSPQLTGLNADQIRTYRLEARAFSARAGSQGSQSEAEQVSLSFSPYVVISGLTPGSFDPNGFLDRSATPRIEIRNANPFGPGANENGRYTVTYSLRFDRDRNRWTVIPGSNFWFNSNGTANVLTLTGPAGSGVGLEALLAGEEKAELFLGPGWARGTFGRLLGLDFVASGSRRLTFGPMRSLQSLNSDTEAQPGPVPWVWGIESGIGRRAFAMLGSRFQFRDARVWIELDVDETVPGTPQAVLDDILQDMDRRTWRAEASTRLNLALTDVEAQGRTSGEVRVRFSVSSDESGGNRRSARLVLPSGSGARLSIENASEVILSVPPVGEPNRAMAELRAELRADERSDGAPGAVFMRVVMRPPRREVPWIGLRTSGLGEIGVDSNQMRLHFDLGADAVTAFALSTPLVDLPLRLDEEIGPPRGGQGRRLAPDSVPGAASGPVFSELSWSWKKRVRGEVASGTLGGENSELSASAATMPAPHEYVLDNPKWVRFELYRRPPATDGLQVEPSAGERDIDRPIDRVVLDWPAGVPETLEEPLLDIGLDGAALRVRRESDNLTLIFRFFNIRIRRSAGRTQLVSLPKQGPELSQVLDQVPERPIISVTVPGGHVLKEAFAALIVSPTDFPTVDMAALAAQEPEVEDLLARLRTGPREERVAIRERIRDLWYALLERWEDFDGLSRVREFEQSLTVAIDRHQRAWGRLRHLWHEGATAIPADQCIYLGPDFFDRDVYALAVALIETKEELLAARIEARLREVESRVEVVRERERLIREKQAELSEAERADIERALADRKGELDPYFKAYAAFHYEKTKSAFGGVEIDGLIKHAELLDFYQKFGMENFPNTARSRMGAPSRLCFFWDTAPNFSEQTAFSLAALLSWDGVELSVPRRAQRLFEIDGENRRRPVIDDAAMLRHQGIRANPAGSLATRMAEVYASARAQIEPHETSLVPLARLHCAVAQDAAIEVERPAPRRFYDLDAGLDNDPAVPLWSLSVGTRAPNPELKAVASPDFRPEVFLSLSMHGHPDSQALKELFLPPDRGPKAPWFRERPRIVDGLPALPETEYSSDEDEDFRAAISPYVRHALVEHSVHGRPGIGALPPEDEPERNAPLVGTGPAPTATVTPVAATTASEARETAANAPSFLAPQGYDLFDVRTIDRDDSGTPVQFRQTILRTQSLDFGELTLTPLGPSIALDATLQLEAPALRTDGERAFSTTSIQAVRSEVTLGEDDRTSVEEKGYLFPCGNKATRVISTRPEIIRPQRATGREEPAAYDLQRTWISVTEPVKSLWFGQPLDGREWPISRLEILDKRTPDLVSPDKARPWNTDNPPPSPDAMVQPSGRINLGPNTEGLVFWPRTAATEKFTFRFEVQLDGSAETVQMPLIFVDFQAMLSPKTMQRLVEYYNSIVSFDDRQMPDPNSLRVIQHNNARRRYARELKDGDSTYETHCWVIGAEGRRATSDSEITGRALISGDEVAALASGRALVEAREGVLARRHDDYVYGPLLALTDQPPFYPFIQMAQLQLDRIARQTGTRAGPVVETTYDKAYLLRARSNGRPGQTASDIATTKALRLPNPQTPDVVLDIRRPARLDIGSRGDRLGAIGRPAGQLVALARREGPFFVGRGTDLLTAIEAQIGEAIVPLAYEAVLAPNVEPDQEARIERGWSVRMAALNDWGPALSGMLVPAQAEVEQPASSRGLADILKLVLGDDDMLILGFLPLKDLISTAVTSFADGIPTIREAREYGSDLVGDAADTIRQEVLTPLAEVVNEIRRRFEETADLRGLTAGSGVNLLDVYPDVAENLAGLDVALGAATQTDSDQFIDSVTRVHASGTALVKALEDVARDPITPLQEQLLESFAAGLLSDELVGAVRGIFDQLTENLGAILSALQNLDSVLVAELRAQLALGLTALASLAVAPGLRASGADGALVTAGEGLDNFVQGSAAAALEAAFGPAGAGVTNVSGLMDRVRDPAIWRVYGQGRVEAFRAAVEVQEIALTARGEAMLRPLLADLAALTADLGTLQATAAAAEAELRVKIEERIAALDARVERESAMLVRQLLGLSLVEFRALVTRLDASLGRSSSGQPEDILQTVVDAVLLLDAVYNRGRLQQQTTILVAEAANQAGHALTEGAARLVLEALCVVDRLTLAVEVGLAPLADAVPKLNEFTAELEALAAGPAQGPLAEAYPAAVEALGGLLTLQSPRRGDRDIELSFFPVYVIDILHRIEARMLLATEELRDGATANLQVAADRVDAAFPGYRQQVFLAVAALMRAGGRVAQAAASATGRADFCPTRDADKVDLLRRVLSGQILAELASVRGYVDSVLALGAELQSTAATMVDVLSFEPIRLIEQISAALTNLSADERQRFNDWLAELKSAGVAEIDALEQELHLAALRAIGEASAVFLLATTAAAYDVADIVLEGLERTQRERQRAMASVAGAVIAASTAAQSVLASSPTLTPLGEAFARISADFSRALVADQEAQLALRKLAELASDVSQLRSNASVETVEELLDRAEAAPQLIRVGLGLPNLPNAGAALRLARDAILFETLAKVSELATLGEDAAAVAVANAAAELRNAVLGPVLAAAGNGVVGPVAGQLLTVYQRVVPARADALLALSEQSSELVQIARLLLRIPDPRTLVIAIDPGKLSAAQIAAEKRRIIEEAGDGSPKDKLQAESQQLATLAAPVELATLDPWQTALTTLAEVFSGRGYRAAPLQIIDTLVGAFEGIVRADVSAFLDFTDVRSLIEDRVRRLVPTRISTELDYETAINGFGDIFFPEGDRKFTVRSRTSVDLLNPTDFVADTRATLSPFKVWLLGSSFDVFTIHFSRSTFVTGVGRKPDFDIRFVDYTIGQQLAFIEDLQSQLGQEGGGLFVKPAGGFPGLEVGYRLNLPAISFGGVTFLNVGLTAGAILPFDKRRAIFSVGVSTRRDPFILIAGIFGGGGHFTLYTSGEKLAGLDASFVGAAGGGLTVGVLTLQARVSIGVYIRRFGDLSETAGDFFAGGSGRVAFFGISTSLMVTTGQDPYGNMVGSAVFSYSFSVGFAKFNFQVTLYRSEGKGFSGTESLASIHRPYLVRFAGPTSGIVGSAPPGVAELRFDVPRKEDNFVGWMRNFARLPGLRSTLPAGFGEM